LTLALETNRRLRVGSFFVSCRFEARAFAAVWKTSLEKTGIYAKIDDEVGERTGDLRED
jgi:hypothetical protein